MPMHIGGMARAETTSGRVAYLDGIRGVAILCVIGTHWRRGLPWMSGGYIGVDLFFVLSGYLITTILLARDVPYGAFLRRRAWRLLPALAGLLIVGTVLAIVLPDSPISAGTALSSALIGALQLGTLWRPATDSAIEPFGVTWSLAAEWYFYLLWPLALTALRRRRVSDRQMRNICLSTAAALYAFALALPADWFYIGPFSRSAELLVGAAVAYHLRHRRNDPDRVSGGWAWVVWIGALPLAAWAVRGPDYLSHAYQLVGLPLAALWTGSVILMVATDDPGRVRSFPLRVLEWPVLTGIGLVSYSVYLWHYVPVILLPEGALGLSTAARTAVGLLSAVVLSAASYIFLERPFLRSRGRRAQVKRTMLPAGDSSDGR